MGREIKGGYSPTGKGGKKDVSLPKNALRQSGSGSMNYEEVMNKHDSQDEAKLNRNQYPFKRYV